MIRKSRLLFGLLLAVPAIAQALGLGDIHLSSGLNQPLAADIEIVGASAEDLVQLRAAIAPRDTFVRHGLDRPAFLTGVTLTVGKDASGRAVLVMRSTETITEPFVTFLVEVSWPRGALVREYTVLLDPPVFEEKPSPTPAVAAPATGTTSAPAAGTVERPSEAAPAAPAAAATAPAPSALPAAASEYRVERNDALSLIARRSGAAGASEINRFMIATFRANPAAFDDNINRLHRGAVLRIPAREEWQAVDAHAAAREVSRQVSEWRGAGSGTSGAGGAEEAHLRLVPPKETGAGTGAEQGKAPTPAPAPAEKPAEAKGRAKIESEQLGRLQQQAQAPAAPKVAPAPPAEKPAAEKPAAAPPAAAPAEAPAAEKPAPKPVKKPVPVAQEPSLLDTLTDNLLYVALAGVVLLFGALIAFKMLRRRRVASAFDESFAGDVTEPGAGAAPAAAPRARGGDTHTIVVEEREDESGEYVAPPLQPAPVRTQAIARETAPGGAAEDTMSSETAINLEQADPLAEADFHMAYGLYDQAADIVKLAIEREPARRDLKLKLLEVYFVWGNKDAFLDVARDLGRTRDQGAAGEWDKVVIMGRQIAGEDPLFAGAPVGGAAAAASGVDIDLDSSGMHRIDLELLGETAVHNAPDAEAVDLDLGQALAGGDALAETGESPTLDPDRIDLMLDAEHGLAAAPTVETPAVKARAAEPTIETPAVKARAPEPTIETPALKARAPEPTIETPALRARAPEPTVETPALKPRPADVPTVETPTLKARAAADVPTVETPSISIHADSAVVAKLDADLKRGERRVAPDATAELSLDDLGFEVDKLGDSSASLPALAITDHPSDAPTMVAGLDDKSRTMLAAAARAAEAEPTRETPRPRAPDLDRTREAPRPASDATGTQRVLGTGDLDLDLDSLAKQLEHDTVEQPRRDEVGFSTDVFGTGIRKGPSGIDLDVGAPLSEHREPTVTERISADDLDLPELEPVTLSEVGTKLDLARAYMDMGDPDGARSILQEVLSEGSASQKSEAQRLIETLPG